MTESALWMLPATEQAAGIRRGDWSAEQLTEAVLTRIDDANPQLNAYCTLDDRALDAAREADATLRRGEKPGPLHGVPFSVKDLIPTKGVRTTLGSLAHRDWIPDADEISVGRMRAAGAILVGKTNTRELGYGAVADNELFGPTRNPWDPRMTATGSSGGAAAAVAAGMGSLALGSDGGGSLRVPAAVCGVFSIKPTFGVVPLYPSCRVPLRAGLDSWESLECIGPITRTVADSALVLSAISGFDARDQHAAPLEPFSVTRPDASRARGLTVAFSADLGIAEVDPEIADLVFAAVRTTADRHGWNLRIAGPNLPSLTALREVFAATVAMDSDLDALQALAEMTTVSTDIRELVERRWTAEDFTRARVARLAVHEELRRFGEDVDLLITPATATTAFPVGLRFPENERNGIADGRQWSPFAFLANLTGQPAASIPAGRTRGGLPVGLQVIGRRFADAAVLDAAQAFEVANPWDDSFG